MPEPFKNFFNEEIIRAMAGHLVRVAPEFDREGFVAYCLDGLDDLELKQRSDRITAALERFLPEDFETAASILTASLDPATDVSVDAAGECPSTAGIRGWAVMPMADYVARRGQNYLAVSLAALKEMTMRFSSEFAIRPFLDNHQGEVLKELTDWARDKNHHVRRLVSEGSRPRLPWAMRLRRFIADPGPVLPLLEVLKDDEEDYVRRSVANNLNDIAKDHPDLVADIAWNWMEDAPPERARLIRHALRSLIKAGHPGALKVLGYGPPKLDVIGFVVLTEQVILGEALEFGIELTSTADTDQPLVIDYVVHLMRANGKTSPKVFKWKTTRLKAGATVKDRRRHPIRPVTTRRYYPGRQRVELLVNGQNLGGGDFRLIVD